MSNKWISKEKNIKDKLVELLPKKIYNLKCKKKFIDFINMTLNTKYKLKYFDNILNIKNVLQHLDYNDLMEIYINENICKYKIKLNIDTISINKYILNRKLNISYSIFHNNRNIINYKNKVYAMHSIGKVFTGMLIMIMLDLKIITENDINSPIQIDPTILNTIPIKVKNRLKTTTMLDAMTHMSGLKNYLTKYFDALKINNKINPLNPEDFVKYIDDDVDKKGIYNYSNAGILLCGLSVQYLYNKNKKTNKTYNEILYEYIIKPSKITTFSIIKPKNGTYNKKNKIASFINGSPGGGYWISSYDLGLFGKFILKIMNTNIKKYLKKYGSEFYDYKNNIIQHSGGINGSLSNLMVYLNYNTSIAIMGNEDKSADILKYAIEYINIYHVLK